MPPQVPNTHLQGIPHPHTADRPGWGPGCKTNLCHPSQDDVCAPPVVQRNLKANPQRPAGRGRPQPPSGSQSHTPLCLARPCQPLPVRCTQSGQRTNSGPASLLLGQDCQRVSLSSWTAAQAACIHVTPQSLNRYQWVPKPDGGPEQDGGLRPKHPGMVSFSSFCSVHYKTKSIRNLAEL